MDNILTPSEINNKNEIQFGKKKLDFFFLGIFEIILRYKLKIKYKGKNLGMMRDEEQEVKKEKKYSQEKS